MNKPELDAKVVSIYNLFVELDKTRQFNQAGVQPLLPSEIRSHLEVIRPWDSDFRTTYKHLLAMDAVALAHYIEAREGD